MITLNVAVNSFSNSLLTLMMSNQFVEIKGSVFKRFEKENLFQISCSGTLHVFNCLDVVERFQLCIYVSMITLRNYIELSGGSGMPSNLLIHLGFDKIIKFFDSITYTSVIKPALLWISRFDLQVGFECLQSLQPSWSSFWGWLSFLASTSSQLFESFSANVNQIVALFAPAVIVLCIELLVDSLKHAFITKFNQIKVSISYYLTIARCIHAISTIIM
jgi:hypothetical protein